MFIVTDQDGNPIYTAGYAQACHEHINDAINEFDIEGAGKWKVVEVMPKQRELELLAVIEEQRRMIKEADGWLEYLNPQSLPDDQHRKAFDDFSRLTEAVIILDPEPSKALHGYEARVLAEYRSRAKRLRRMAEERRKK